MSRILPLSVALLAVLAAPVAHAITEQDVIDAATALQADYEDLQDRIDACPAGQCSEAAQIVSDFEELEVERGNLHSLRAQLGGSHPTLDAIIADVDALAAVAEQGIAGWE